MSWSTGADLQGGGANTLDNHCQIKRLVRKCDSRFINVTACSSASAQFPNTSTNIIRLKVFVDAALGKKALGLLIRVMCIPTTRCQQISHSQTIFFFEKKSQSNLQICVGVWDEVAASSLSGLLSRREATLQPDRQQQGSQVYANVCTILILLESFASAPQTPGWKTAPAK